MGRSHLLPSHHLPPGRQSRVGKTLRPLPGGRRVVDPVRPGAWVKRRWTVLVPSRRKTGARLTGRAPGRSTIEDSPAAPTCPSCQGEMKPTLSRGNQRESVRHGGATRGCTEGSWAAVCSQRGRDRRAGRACLRDILPLPRSSGSLCRHGQGLSASLSSQPSTLAGCTFFP